MPSVPNLAFVPISQEVDPRRSLILSCARLAFVENGFASAGIEPIARRAGVSTATLYGFFPSKGDLFSAVILQSAQESASVMRETVGHNGSATERLTEALNAYAGFLSAPFTRSIFRLLMAEQSRFKAVAQEFYQIGRDNIADKIVDLVADLAAKSQIVVDRPSWAAGQIMGMI